MRYLYQCAHTYIHDTYSPELWKSIENDIDFVLTHPNGWEGAQQSQIRSAAVLAGLIADTPDGHSRLQLLTEGEASLHFCLNNGVTSESMMVGILCLIVMIVNKHPLHPRTARESSLSTQVEELST
jgi:hypothetical protein